MTRPSAVSSIAGAALLALATCAAAQDADPVSFGGEDYRVASRETAANGNSIVEMVRAGDNIDSWKKLVAFHRFPELDDAKAAANELATLARQRDPSSHVRVMENAETSEVIVDFTASEANSDVVELDVFKYGASGEDEGLTAFQFAQRFPRANADELSKVRDAAVNEVAEIDLALADSYLGGDEDDEATSDDKSEQ